MQSLFAKQMLTAEGWRQDVRVDIENGVITAITPATIGAAQYDLLLAGMPNIHSHAFQWAMGGLTEHRSGSNNDNFWSWREVMYRFLERLTPEYIEIIAQAFYIELLKSGYTAIGEFHYLHHNAEGNPYDNPAELSERIISAAQNSGIHLTLLPVLYQTSNFGGVPAMAGQRRFLHSTDAFLRLMDKLSRYTSSNIILGAAPHSLRAVPAEALAEIVKLSGPIHIHAAEQTKEVDDCLAWCGKRPVQWLLDNHDINERWCLIHSTHLSEAEILALAKSGAVAGLCPSTEANLGDGIFPAEAFLQAGGRFGIGSDSHITVNPFDELRLMEYAQRLQHRRRNVLCDEAIPSVGRNLYHRAVTGGRQALGINDRADLVAIDCSAPLLQGKQGDALLNSLIFATTQPKITDVYVAGNHVIKDGHHVLEEHSNAALADAMRELMA
jgi:formimidoylglutamate deiminase